MAHALLLRYAYTRVLWCSLHRKQDMLTCFSERGSPNQDEHGSTTGGRLRLNVNGILSSSDKAGCRERTRSCFRILHPAPLARHDPCLC